MKRKVNKVGQSTLTVSLPKKWCERHGVVSGYELEIREDNESLVLLSNGTIPTKKFQLHLRMGEQFFKRFLLTAYVQGYDEIEVTWDSSIGLKEIKEVLTDLLGYEIVEQKEHSCTIKSISIIVEQEFEQMLRRVFLLNKSMLSAIYSTTNEEGINLGDAIEMEKSVNKFVNFCLRALNKRTDLHSAQKVFLALFLDHLEQLADHLRDLAKLLMKVSIQSQRVKTILYQVKELFELIYSTYYKYNNRAANELRLTSRSLRKCCIEALSDKKENHLVLAYLLSITGILEHMLFALSPSFNYQNSS